MNESLNILKALADETRLNIVEYLLEGEKCVCEIVPHTKRAFSTVSLQLNKLETLGVLESRRQGRWVFYRIKDRRIHSIFKALGEVK